MGIPDDELVNPTSVSNVLRCIICTEVFTEPVYWNGRPCQHVFCRPCILQALKRSRQCPSCRADVEPDNLLPHHAIRDLLDELDVRCSKLCGWTGRQDARPSHMAVCPLNKLAETKTTIKICISSLEAGLSDAARRVANLSAELQETRVTIDSCHTKIAMLESAVEEHKTASDRRDAKISEQAAHIRELEHRASEQEKRIEMQTKLLQLYEEKVAQKRAEISRMKEEIDAKPPQKETESKAPPKESEAKPIPPPAKSASEKGKGGTHVDAPKTSEDDAVDAEAQTAQTGSSSSSSGAQTGAAQKETEEQKRERIHDAAEFVPLSHMAEETWTPWDDWFWGQMPMNWYMEHYAGMTGHPGLAAFSGFPDYLQYLGDLAYSGPFGEPVDMGYMQSQFAQMGMSMQQQQQHTGLPNGTLFGPMGPWGQLVLIPKGRPRRPRGSMSGTSGTHPTSEFGASASSSSSQTAFSPGPPPPPPPPPPPSPQPPN